jgi:Cell wall-associated hydrolases (invasion-associated proteins)
MTIYVSEVTKGFCAMSGFRRLFSHTFGRCCFLGAILAVAGCAGPGKSPSSSAGLQQIAPSHRQEVVMTAMGLVGAPYRYGGNDPAKGFDCSGLVNYVFRMAAGAGLPRDTAGQAGVSRAIDARELQYGDLVFFNTLGRPNSHVGIYIGDRRFVNAPSSGGRVRVDSLDSPYFSKRFTSARSLFARQ